MARSKKIDWRQIAILVASASGALILKEKGYVPFTAEWKARNELKK